MPAVLQTGFRPFFLVAALAAAVLPGLWAAVFTGALPLSTPLPGVVWHAHELLLGFTAAVLAGFLLTAVRNWTKRPTLSGAPLAGLVALWLAGRVLAWIPVPAIVAAAVDAAFFAALAVGIGRPILATHNRRNYAFPAMVAGLGALDVSIHLRPDHALVLLRGALDVVVVAMVIVTGRIVPLFTANALPGALVIRRPQLDLAALVGVVGVLVAELLSLPGVVTAGAAGLAGLALAGRAASWDPRAALRVPLLAILHVGHGWLAVGLLLRAADAAGLDVPASAATHALTAGAIGCLTLGMMARVSLGHTGRPLVASRTAAACFAAVTLAAVLRVAAGWGLPAPLLAASAALYGLAFFAWVVVDGRVLLAPRADGRPG